LQSWQSIPGEQPEIEGELNLRMCFPQELDTLLKYNGFEIEDKFGDNDQKEFDSDSEIQLIVCRKAVENQRRSC
jgi:hypothetical protein